jgi:cob(I)alamin adenosyltransferase
VALVSVDKYKLIMAISTGQGDSGTTKDLAGNPCDKCCSHITALGTIDELNSQLGVVLTFELSEKTWRNLEKTQKILFKLGADLSTPPFTKQKRIDEDDIKSLKNQIDDLQDKLPKLTKFVLPGGCPAACQLHVARTICRRAETELVKTKQDQSINPKILVYINKLSDLFFLLALFENQENGIKEKLVGLDENLTPFLD